MINSGVQSRAMQDVIEALLRDPAAPWRMLATVTLTDALNIASAAGVEAALESRESGFDENIIIEASGSNAPETIIFSREDGPRIEAKRSRQSNVATIEFRASISLTVVHINLVLSSPVGNICLPVITGDHAAVLSHGWAQNSAGRSAPMRVHGNALADALRRLSHPNVGTITEASDTRW